MNLCCSEGCLNEAAWAPVLLLYSILGEDPAEVHSELGYCYGCRARVKVKELLPKEQFQKIYNVFLNHGLVPPHYDRTEVRWEPLGYSLDLANEVEGRLAEPGY